jgi:hypothetical protein
LKSRQNVLSLAIVQRSFAGAIALAAIGSHALDLGRLSARSASASRRAVALGRGDVGHGHQPYSRRQESARLCCFHLRDLFSLLRFSIVGCLQSAAEQCSLTPFVKQFLRGRQKLHVGEIYFAEEVGARTCRDCNFPDFSKNITMKMVFDMRLSLAITD